MKVKVMSYKLWVMSLIILLSQFSILHSQSRCYAQPVSSIELINNAKLYDGKTVTYEGEVIGEVMVRGEYAWINVNDGQNAVGIWVNKNLTQDILYAGNYKFKGDGLEITGIFHRACPEHGGDLDIHAQGLRKIRPGRQTLEKLNLGKRNLALVLLGVLCLVWILRQLKIK
jgi:hypothetical protein